jgi:hypothetical protein
MVVFPVYVYLNWRLPSNYDIIVSETDGNHAQTSSPTSDSDSQTSSTFIVCSKSRQILQASKTRCVLPVMACGVLLWLSVCVWLVLQQTAGWLQLSDSGQVTLMLVTLPLRSAFNPLLLWLGIGQERRRGERRARLMK